MCQNTRTGEGNIYFILLVRSRRKFPVSLAWLWKGILSHALGVSVELYKLDLQPT